MSTTLSTDSNNARLPARKPASWRQLLGLLLLGSVIVLAVFVQHGQAMQTTSQSGSTAVELLAPAGDGADASCPHHMDAGATQHCCSGSACVAAAILADEPLAASAPHDQARPMRGSRADARYAARLFHPPKPSLS